MNIIHTQHLKDMLKERRFPYSYPKRIYLEAEEKYIDRSTKSFIAIKKLPHKNKMRKIVIAYVIENENVKILTIYAEKDKDITKRVINGRWIKI